MRQELVGHLGTPVQDSHGRTARFSILVEGGTVTGLGFRASTCITLVAYCERLCEIASGRDAASILRMRPADVVAALPGVPAARHDQAVLALRALHGALADCLSADPRPAPTITRGAPP